MPLSTAPLQKPQDADREASITRLRRRLRLALFTAGLCAFAMILISEFTHHQTASALREIQYAHSLRTGVSTLLRRLTEAESSQRGYILTGDTSYLSEYQDHIARIPVMVRELEPLEPQNEQMSRSMHAFTDALSQKLGEMALTVRLREAGRADVVNFVINSKMGQEHMVEARNNAEALIKLAQDLVLEKRLEINRLLNVSRFGLAAGAIAAFFAFFLYIGQTRALERAGRDQQDALEAERDALGSQVKQRTIRLTELANHLQEAVEKERAHLARELHDELGALLTAAKLDVARLKSRLPEAGPELLDRLKHLTETLNQGIALKRRIIEDLRPSSLSNLGLVSSLEILAREFGERSGIEVQTVLEPVDLDDTRELTIYRMVQEALTNIGKYAEATQVVIKLQNYVHHAEVSVTDNGKGFDPAVLPQSSHGLHGMRHRVEASGGRLDITSAPGHGTSVLGTVPRLQAKNQSELATALDDASMSSPSYTAAPSTPTEAIVHG